MSRFEGKRVIITGGISGIGACVVRRFLDEGARVAVVDLEQGAIDSFVAKEERGELLLGVAADISKPAEATAAVRTTVEAFGGLDVLINNAGVVGKPQPVDEIEDADWRFVMSVDVDGVFHMTRAAMPYLKASEGSIVNTASDSGLGGDRSMVAYDTAKGAVVNFTRATAIDGGRHGVRVNAVCPGPVNTPIMGSALKNQDIFDLYAQRMPLGRVAEPDDIAAAMAFLASDDAAYITGIALPVDGGLNAWSGQPNIAIWPDH